MSLIRTSDVEVTARNVFHFGVCLLFCKYERHEIMSKATRCYFVVLFSLFVMFLYISNTLIGVVNQQQYNGTKDFINGLINEWQEGQELQEWTTNEVAPNISHLESVNDSFISKTSRESTVHALSENVSSFCSKTQSNALIRLQDHCNTRSQNWTEVIFH